MHEDGGAAVRRLRPALQLWTANVLHAWPPSTARLYGPLGSLVVASKGASRVASEPDMSHVDAPAGKFDCQTPPAFTFGFAACS